MIIDPIRDLTKYLKVADKEGFTITKAAETHIHADFASGIRDVANKLNASIYVSDEGKDEFNYKICLNKHISLSIKILSI